MDLGQGMSKTINIIEVKNERLPESTLLNDLSAFFIDESRHQYTPDLKPST
ncbi:MAG: hypothetical protein LBK47_07065 [Prevotellaceae bacterium]|nr:hypothetical protein [Prevotellaceae bacterium]